MLEKSFGLRFYLKQSKTLKAKRRYVYLRITVDGKAKELSLKRTWNPDKWNQEKGRASGNQEDAASLNSFIESITAKIYQTKKIFFDDNRELTAESLANVILGIEPQNRMILDIFSRHIESVKMLIGTIYKERTFRRYKTTYSHLASFIDFKFHCIDLELKLVNHDLVLNFYYWLRKEKNCSYNSAVKYLSIFKRITILCKKKGWIKTDPFIDVKTSPKEVPVSPLSKNELKLIRDNNLICPRLAAVRDIFIFCCYTGLAYVDVKNLKHNEIVDGTDGNKWIYLSREKTEVSCQIPLLKIALQILNDYENHPKCISSNYVLPVLSNQRMNSYLKEISIICGVKRRITFHIARHTFATTITLGNGVPIETVSKMLGHKSIKQTQHYAKVLETKVSEDMEILKSRLKIVK
jgi:site-specific recombinase XerD